MMSTPAVTPAPRFLRLPEVAQWAGVSPSTIARWEAAGEFPPRRRLGRNVIAWSISELDAWAATLEVGPEPGRRVVRREDHPAEQTAA